MILAIDAGNSRTKWAVFDDTEQPDRALKMQGMFINAELAQAATPAVWKACEQAVISNVAGGAVTQSLHAMLQPLAIAMHTVTPAVHGCDVHNGYTDPQQLGSDRWSATVAAWQRYRAPCIIANAGTALTIDALGVDQEATQGIFLGGLILPGFRLMQQSLVQGTAGLTEMAGSLKEFPAATGDGLHTGALSAMAGAVLSMMLKLQRREGHVPYCLLSGGDAPLLAEAMTTQAEFAFSPIIVDNLVLHGLLLIGRGCL
jgi:type III pantothenate kinase